MNAADFSAAMMDLDRVHVALLKLPLEAMREHILTGSPSAISGYSRARLTLDTIDALEGAQRRLAAPAARRRPYSVEQADARDCAGGEAYDGDPSRTVLGQRAV